MPVGVGEVSGWKVLTAVLATLLGMGEPSAPARSLDADDTVDRIVISKARHTLEAWSGERLLRTYRVALGSGGAGPKRWEGDAKTPVGRYRIDGRFPSRRFHRFLRVSYPNAADRAAYERARAAGLVPDGAGVGGAIGIHGEKRGWGGWPHKEVDWTLGCIALDDAEVEELYEAVMPGAVVEIRP